MREHDVSRLTASELQRARRELAASLALSRPDSPIRVPISSHMSAIDVELTERATARLCSCGFATDDGAWFDGHLFDYPAHTVSYIADPDARHSDDKLPIRLETRGDVRIWSNAL